MAPMTKDLTPVRFDPDMHYGTVAAWWGGHDWPVVPVEALPPIGIIVGDYAAGWLYKTERSPWGWLEWIVTNPMYSGDGISRDTHKAVSVLVETLLRTAQAIGCKWVFTSTESTGLITMYERHGFQTTDKEFTNLICNLEQL